MAPCGLPENTERLALHQALAVLPLAQRSGRPYAISQAHLLLARSYRALQALDSSAACLDEAVRWSRWVGAVDMTVDLLCECSELAALQAEKAEAEVLGAGRPARERARTLAYEVSRLAAQVADPEWEIKVLLRISDVLDRCGSPADAAVLQTRAMRLISGTLNTEAPDPAHLPGLDRLADV